MRIAARWTRVSVLCALALAGCSDDDAGPTRDPGLWPFSATSPWNTPIGVEAEYAEVDSPGLDLDLGASMNVTEWSHPVYLASDADPVRTFYRLDDGSECASVPVPDDAVPALGTDAHLHVVSPDHLTVVETWLTVRLASQDFESGACVVNELRGPGVYSDWHGVRAYGGSAIAGLIRRGEITRGIPHALAAAVPPGAMNRNGPGGNPWVWPASSADDGAEVSYADSGNLFMGSLLAIPPEVDVAGLGLSAPALAIARALQDYGAYITDSGGGDAMIGFYAEPAAADELALDLWDDFLVLAPLLQVVTSNAEATPGGGGTPRAPAAPPFDR